MPEPVEEIAGLLRSQGTLTLATVSPDGLPRSASLFYVVGEGVRLYWFSSASSEHSRNLRERPEAAVSVYRPTERWQEILGVQMEGRVEVVRDRALRHAVTTAYVERFRLGKVFAAAIARSRLYVFVPDWARLVDNAQGFGHKMEVSLGS